MLTTSVDSGAAFTGTEKGDVFKVGETLISSNLGDHDGFPGTPDTWMNQYTSHLNSLDVLDGGAGKDTLNVETEGAIATVTANISNIETINLKSGAGVTFDTTTYTGVETLNVSKATTVNVDAALTTDINVSGATGATIDVDGGKNIDVQDATANNTTKVGAATVNAGTITVTDTNLGTGLIEVDGGTNVTITATGSNTGTGGNSVKVGQGGATTDLPTGEVTIVNNITNAAAAATNITGGDILVKGGSTISVTETAVQGVMTTASTNSTITQGDVKIVAGTNTTTVNVKQDAAVAAVNTVLAVAGNAEAQTVTFGAMTTNQTLTINRLTFTAAKNLTAAEVASAFANLVISDTQGEAKATNGTFDGTFTFASTTLAMTSGAVTTANGVSTVTFTSTTNTNLAPLTITGAAASVTKTVDGVPTFAATGKGGIANGVVLIDDNTTAASITTVTVDGYATGSRIGTTIDTTVLSSLTLKNAAAGVSMTVDDTAATLALTVGNMGTSTDTNEAVVAFTVAPTTLNVSGDASLVLSGAESDTLTSVTTTTTGTVTSSIDGTKATYTGGAGVDNVTLVTTTALAKAIDLGAGNDTLTFNAAVASSTATLSGGAGTDTLAMTVANADSLDVLAQTLYTNFEKLTLTDAAGTDDNSEDPVTINLANLGLAAYVTSNGTILDTTMATNSDILELTNMSTGGTLQIVAAAAGANTKHTVSITNAAATENDTFNLEVSSAAALNVGTVTVANVETVNISAIDTDTASANADSLVLTAANATAVTVTGNASLTLVMTGSTSVTSINASTMEGGLTVTSLNTTAATTITGGAGIDILTAASGSTADVLIGGAGNDILTANAGLNTLTGGTGNDTFVIGTASLNSSSYATITDFTAGDSIKFSGADSFNTNVITLANTAVFQDYVNTAINSVTTANDLAWFNFGGDTYIVGDMTNNSTSFVNGEDFIVKITGVKDLSTASFNDTTDTIQIA